MSPTANMFASQLIVVLLIITLKCINASVISDIMIQDLAEKDVRCTERRCITKCCEDDMYIGRARMCVKNNDTSIEPFLDFREVVVHDQKVQGTKKRLRDSFFLVPAELSEFSRVMAFDLSLKFNNYLIEDGTVQQELPNTYNRWKLVTRDLYCLDYALPNGKTVFKAEPRFWTIPPDEEPDDDLVVELMAGALLVSSVFLALVLVVYCLTPELRNLCGLILMAYVASLLGAFVVLATIQIITMVELHTREICLGLTFALYYCFLSSFCWMNVMSFDIWWTFRGYAKARPIHRRGETFKFGVYCSYAWGLPALLTAMLGILNDADLRHAPWFIKPNLVESGCLFEGAGKFIYLYVPMLTMIVVNWLFFIMTAFNVWRLSRGTAVLDSPAAGNPAAHRTHRHRFMVYLKLSVIMGVSWVLEVVSFLAPQYRVWYLSDAYNLLIGVAIFLIFVCKKKIFRKLAKRARLSERQWLPYSKSRSNSSGSTDSDASQDTTSQLICSNPTGVTYSFEHKV